MNIKRATEILKEGGYWSYEDAQVEILKDTILAAIGLVKSVSREDDMILFETTDGRVFQMYHSQDCCESVSIEDICGDLDDLIGTPLLLAEQISSEPPADHNSSGVDSETWTFYKFSTVKGDVTIRWYGTSNGYYSEGVSFREIKEPHV